MYFPSIPHGRVISVHNLKNLFALSLLSSRDSRAREMAALLFQERKRGRKKK
jgi:hypothetical protein